ncbi:alpha-L-rhamnosidase, partial [bacterium]
TDPLGLDVTAPRFSWKMHDDRRGARQTAYRVIVSDADAAVSTVPVWDSGKVDSDQQTHVVYAGPELASRRRLRWRARVWNADGIESPWSTAATLEMGLLERADWRAKWIGADEVGGPRTSPPCPYLRREFVTPEKPIRARLYITALGLFEAELNGQRVGDDCFAPGRTEYGKRVPYHVYDVTDQIDEGANAIGVILADGWYSGHVHSDPRMFYGDRPRLLAQLELSYADGSTDVIVSDGSWRYSTNGPIRSSDLLQGEDYDARMELGDWSRAGYDDDRWRDCVTFGSPNIALVARRVPPVRRIEERPARPDPVMTPNGLRWTFDLGQNMVGRIRIKLRNTQPGQIVTMRFAEMLDKDGRVYMQALRTARCTDYYTCKGAAEEIYEPRFTFHGFRYVEINRVSPRWEKPPEDAVTGIVMNTDVPWTGEFVCSAPLINQLQSNIRWSQRGNFLEIPTDCPQRDERLGWTGDAQVFIRTAAWNMDVAGFFTKWLQDMEDAQYDTGGIPSTVPYCVSIPNEGGPAWSDAAVICPWTLYLCYGDTRLLAERYGMMQRFVDFLVKSSNGLIRADETNKWRGYGDWLNMNAETPKDLIGTAFTAHSADLMAKIAGVLGKLEDVQKYRQLGDDVRAAWQRKYVTPAGEIVGQTQTAYVLALHFRLVPFALRESVLKKLVADIESRGNHLSTGFVGTPYLTQVLTEGGRIDVAYKLLNQTTFPGWLFPITHGATTMWERWDGWTPEKGFASDGMNSYNHYAYGAVGAWMYATIAGIDLDPSRPAYKHSIIAPKPGGGLTNARGALDTLYGKIESDWRLEGETLTLNVRVPANTTATIHVPAKSKEAVTESENFDGLTFVDHRDGAAIYEATAGRYTFTSEV